MSTTRSGRAIRSADAVRPYVPRATTRRRYVPFIERPLTGNRIDYDTRRPDVPAGSWLRNRFDNDTAIQYERYRRPMTHQQNRRIVLTNHFADVVRNDLVDVRSGVGHDRKDAARVLYTALQYNPSKGQALAGDYLAGFSVREITDIVELSGRNKNEFYLSGVGYEMRVRSSADGAPIKGSYVRIRLNDFPLALIETTGIGATLMDGLESSLTADQFTAERSDVLNYLSFLKNHPPNAGVVNGPFVGGDPVAPDGSMVSSLVLTGDVRLVWRRPLSAVQANDQASVRLRIAGFDKLLPWNQVESFLSSGGGLNDGGQKRYEVFIPGGEVNCVIASFTQGVYKAWLDDERGVMKELIREGKRELRAELCLTNAETFCKSLYEEWRECEIQIQLARNQSYIRERGREATIRMLRSRFERLNAHGFSSTYLKRFILYVLKESGIFIEVYCLEASEMYAKTNLLWEKFQLRRALVSNRDLRIHCMNWSEEGEPKYRVSILQVDVNGDLTIMGRSIIDDVGNREDISTDNPLIHAVNVYPSPKCNGIYRKGMFNLMTRCDKLTGVIKRFFNKLISMCDVNELDSYSVPGYLPLLVTHQNDRQATIIKNHKRFSEKIVLNAIDDGDGTSSSSSSSSSVSSSSSNVRSIAGVIAYDLETVENLRGIQDVVADQFKSEIPSPPSSTTNIGVDGDGNSLELLSGDDLNVFIPVEAQIPYSVQFGFVRLGGSPPIEPKDVIICLGRGKGLGECVVEFLDEVLRECIVRKMNKVYAYAHNGCGFDAYLIKMYNYKYPMKNILITPRGILSMTIELAKGVHIYFRDTKVHFGGALSELCEVFKVPEAFCKTDFPITRIHGRNCFDKNVLAIASEYMINDVLCLGYIIDGINSTIKHLNDVAVDVLEIGSIITKARFQYEVEIPPISQFVTVMSLVKRIQKQLFYVKFKIPVPIPVDIPALRKWITYANVGGRTTAYWRSFYSSKAKDIIESFLTNPNHSSSPLLAARIKTDSDYCQVWDVTSLYPYALSNYPMPCVSEELLKHLDPMECEELIRKLHCLECRRLWRLCERHRCGGVDDLMTLGLGFIFIRNVKKIRVAAAEEENSGEEAAGGGLGKLLLNLVPRKQARGHGLVYSFQSNEELAQYHGYHYDCSNLSDACPQFPDVQCYCMTDVYWLRECGFSFDVVGGVLFGTSYVFRESIHTLFKERIVAKEREKAEGLPKCFSTFIKLLVNGWYGVWCQKSITDTYLIERNFTSYAKLYSDKKLKPDEIVVKNTKTHQAINGDYLIKVEKVKGACETYGFESACQVGAAVTSFSRHHMNLAMYDLSMKGLVGYTDTDSMAIHASGIDWFNQDRERADYMYNESAAAPMGTYKNDHEEGKGGGEMVFLSLFVAKKVKLHMTIDPQGTIRIYPTFKGFNPSPIDRETGEHVHPKLIMKQKAVAVVNAYFSGYLEEVTQTEFRRSVTDGIHIDKNAKFSASLEAFCGSSGKGSFFRTIGDSSSVVEYLVPHGGGNLGIDLIEHPFFKNLKGVDGGEVSVCTLADASFDNERHDAAVRELTGGITKEMILDFLDKFYEVKESGGGEVVGENNSSSLHYEAVFDRAPQLTRADFFWRK